MTLVVGDVHGCAAELESLLDHVGDADVVLVGDLYTKGPDPAGVWRLVRDRGLRAVMGNHDLRLLGCLDGERAKDVHGHEVIAALDAEGGDWQSHLRSLPLFLDLEEVLVVHAGLHPDGASATSQSMAVAMRTWPPGSSSWWGSAYEGPRRVVYGHDARRGLQRTDWVLGLDTGCVYGGQLTGWVIEEDRLVQVPAARVYQAVGSSG